MTSMENTKKKELSGDTTPTKWIKSITPKGDVSWYVKWISVFLILFATVARSVGTMPQVDMWFGLFGTIGWAWVGYLWHDRALLVLNVVLVTLLVLGLTNYYFGI